MVKEGAEKAELVGILRVKLQQPEERKTKQLCPLDNSAPFPKVEWLTDNHERADCASFPGSTHAMDCLNVRATRGPEPRSD